MRGFIGDVVIVMFLYSSVRIFSHTSQLRTIFMILILAYSVEILQHLDILGSLGLEHNTFARLIL